MKSVQEAFCRSLRRRSTAVIVLTQALLFVAVSAVAAQPVAGRRDANAASVRSPADHRSPNTVVAWSAAGRRDAGAAGASVQSSTMSRDAAAAAAIAANRAKAVAANDSIAEAQIEAQLQDDEAQDFNSLFDDFSDDDGIMAIDTSFAWNNNRINSGRFDYKSLGDNDTIKIPLIDSAQNKLFAQPFPNYITSPFGKRRFLWHYGMDIKLAKGDTVRSAFDGVVRVIQYDRRGYGNVVVVRHHNGLETVYGHLFKVLVRPNQHVKFSETVGLGGNTGRSTGAHLHFEMRYYGEPFDPRHAIDYETHTLWNDTLILTKGDFEYLTELRKTVYHTVRRGEGLGSIARRYRTTVNSLCKLNGITAKTPLSVGKRLVVRGAKEEAVQDKVGIPAEAGGAAGEEAMNTKSIGNGAKEGVDVGGDGLGDKGID
jgi:murein DD-endopeptidase MepM/ murein hydrolase activator NlpD